MKTKILYIILTITVLLNIYFTYNHFKRTPLLATNIDNNTKKVIAIDNEHSNKIKIYYPITNYKNLNQEIEKQINYYIEEFESSLSSKDIQPNQYYTLNIDYEQYNYQKYISYVFYIETSTGGAHPNHDIWSITYDTKNQKIITIETLQNNNKNIINELSTYTRENLNKNKKLSENEYISDMLLTGTSPNKNNFENFAFSKNGLIIFFKRYQIAPYSFGNFTVTIPYNKLDLNI